MNEKTFMKEKQKKASQGVAQLDIGGSEYTLYIAPYCSIKFAISKFLQICKFANQPIASKGGGSLGLKMAMSGRAYQDNPQESDAAHEKKYFSGGRGCPKP